METDNDPTPPTHPSSLLLTPVEFSKIEEVDEKMKTDKGYLVKSVTKLFPQMTIFTTLSAVQHPKVPDLGQGPFGHWFLL